jgi:protein-arginine kinase activator protein McsA
MDIHNEPDPIDMMDEQELRRELRKAVGLYLDMVATFKHRHVNNGIDDGCKQCGRDLRDEVHVRVVA